MPGILARSSPAAPRLTSAPWIAPQSRRQSCRAACAPLVHRYARSHALSKSDPVDHLAQVSSTPTPPPNPHRARRTAGAPPTAISCLGAFRTPAAAARGQKIGGWSCADAMSVRGPQIDVAVALTSLPKLPWVCREPSHRRRPSHPLFSARDTGTARAWLLCGPVLFRQSGRRYMLNGRTSS